MKTYIYPILSILAGILLYLCVGCRDTEPVYLDELRVVDCTGCRKTYQVDVVSANIDGAIGLSVIVGNDPDEMTLSGKGMNLTVKVKETL